MSDDKKIQVGDPIRSKESEDLIKQLRYLVARHNSLCAIERAISNSDEIAELYVNAMKEMAEAECSSMAVLLAMTIEAANDKIHDLKDESDNDIELREKARKLEKENKELKLRLATIAELLERKG